MPVTVTTPTHMKLGIACVYFFRDEDTWIMDLQLDFIEKTTTSIDFTVYAAANRLQPELKEKLAARRFVKIVDLPHFDGDGGPEHGFYMGELLKHAAADGCTHLCTLDSDSFPIAADWPEQLLAAMQPSHRLAAVFRAENQDSDLPHPCGIFMETGLFTQLNFDFFPDAGLRNSSEFKHYIRQTGQRTDTGTGLGFALWQANEPWLKLYRSNKTDLHYLMAGIYGDVFFHLGASSRNPAFHLDYASRLGLRFSLWVKDVPVIWRLGRWFDDRYIAENRRLANKIRASLAQNPVEFIQQLQTNPA